jgi:serine/threonine-protein kinase
MASLMFKITNEEAADITTYNPQLPECLVTIVNKALTKEIDKRYQTGTELSKDLKLCLSTIQ